MSMIVEYILLMDIYKTFPELATKYGESDLEEQGAEEHGKGAANKDRGSSGEISNFLFYVLFFLF